METERIKELLNGQEPIAIVRYFEWAIFSRNNVNAKYLLLKMDNTKNDIHEMDIPDGMVTMLRSRLDDFELVLHGKNGTIWERSSFRERVRESVPITKIADLIDLY